MAGSKRYFRYKADDGNEYFITGDESNIEMVQGAQIPAQSFSGLQALPKNLKPRNVRLQSATGVFTKSVVVLTPERFAQITPGQIFNTGATGYPENTQFAVRSKNGERLLRFPTPEDDGLNDGDNP